jgi:hypothetical protein
MAASPNQRKWIAPSRFEHGLQVGAGCREEVEIVERFSITTDHISRRLTATHRGLPRAARPIDRMQPADPDAER